MNKRLQLIILAILVTIGLVVRLYKIDNPVADWHSWRQADTAAVTRNYFKYGINLFYPKYDDFSDVSGRNLYNPDGYRFVEFPVFNLTHYSLAKIFPQKPLEYWGRMTSILASLVSSILLFFIVRRHSKPIIGLLTTAFFLLLPYNIYFSRVILPDPFMVMLALVTLNLFDLWISKPRAYLLIFTGLVGAITMLTKPISAFLFLPMVWQVWQKYRFSTIKKYYLYILFACIVAPYLIWRQWESNFPQGIPASKWLLNGNHIRFKGAFFQWIFGERIGSMILGSWGILPFLSGFISAPSYLLMWPLAALIYLFTFATGNVQHDYYQIPIIPAISILLALGCNYLWSTLSKKIILVVSLLFMFAFSWYAIRGDYQVNHWEIIRAGQAIDRLTPKDAVVVAPYMGDTAFLYQTNRRGFPYLSLPIKDFIDIYHASYYVSTNYDDATNAIMKKYVVIEKTPEYVVVKLVEPYQDTL